MLLPPSVDTSGSRLLLDLRWSSEKVAFACGLAKDAPVLDAFGSRLDTRTRAAPIVRSLRTLQPRSEALPSDPREVARVLAHCPHELPVVGRIPRT